MPYRYPPPNRGLFCSPGELFYARRETESVLHHERMLRPAHLYSRERYSPQSLAQYNSPPRPFHPNPINCSPQYASPSGSRLPYLLNTPPPGYIHSVNTSPGSCLSGYVSSPCGSIYGDPPAFHDHNSTLSTTDSSLKRRYTPRRSCGHRLSTTKDWISCSLSDPWDGLRPIKTPEAGVLVTSPVVQCHTLLFLPRERRKSSKNGASDVSPAKRSVLDEKLEV